MKLLSRIVFVCLLAVLTIPAWCQDYSLAQLIAGKAMPLTLPIKTLTAEWVRMSVSGQPGVSEMTSLLTSMMGGQQSGVFYSKGQMITLEGEKFLVAYAVPRKPVDPSAMREGPRKLEPLTADTQLSLSLLKMQTLGSLLDIRPFDLKQETVDAATAAENLNKAAIAAKKAQSVNNLRQLAVAALMYAQDHNEQLPTDMNTLVAAVKVEKTILVMPETKEPYLMNAKLAGKTMTAFKNPTDTILFYEPQPWPDGQRQVAYLDGHVASLTEEAWKTGKEKAGIP